MNELTQALNRCLANTFVMYFRAHSYHWNVEGVHFSQYHEFFGDIYEEVYDAIDGFAEKIRMEQQFAPMSLSELYKYATINEDQNVPEKCQEMVYNLYKTNTDMLSTLNEAFNIANVQNKQGLANFLADRIESHKKHEWMLRVSMKGM